MVIWNFSPLSSRLLPLALPSSTLVQYRFSTFWYLIMYGNGSDVGNAGSDATGIFSRKGVVKSIGSPPVTGATVKVNWPAEKLRWPRIRHGDHIALELQGALGPFQPGIDSFLALLGRE